MQGMAQVAARRWLAHDSVLMTRDEAADLIAALAWRGIRGFPLTHPPHEITHPPHDIAMGASAD